MTAPKSCECQPAKRIETFENDYHLLNIYNVQNPLNSTSIAPPDETDITPMIPDGFIKTKDGTFETVKKQISSFELGIFFSSL